MIRTVGLAVALLIGAPGLSAVALAEGKIVISNWDGYMPKDLPEKFKAETGIEVEVAVHATNEEIMGKVVASGGKGYDVLFVSSPFAEALAKLGIAGKIDHSKIPNLKNLYPEAAALKHDPGNQFSIPYAWGTTGLCYRSDIVKEAPDSWNDLLEQVKALLTDAKKTLLAYDDTTFYSKLVSGEAHLVQAWDGWCNYGITENDKIKYVVPKEGSDLWVDTMVVVGNSPNQEAAHKFIDYILKPETGKWVAENIMYKVPNKAAMEALDKGMLEKYPNLAYVPADLLKYEQLRDLGAGMKTFSKVVTEVMSAK